MINILSVAPDFDKRTIWPLRIFYNESKWVNVLNGMR